MSLDYLQEYLEHDGQRLGLHVYPEPPDPDAPAVVFWPAMGVPARYYRRFAAELVRAGLAVVVADLRGTGSSTPPPTRRSRYGYLDLAGDVGAVLRALTTRLAGRRVILVGHSLGGQACALRLGLDPHTRVDGLVLVAVGLPYWRAYHGRRRLWVLQLTQGIAVAVALLRVWPGRGFGGRQARGVIRDWAYTARHGRYPRRSGLDPETALRRVDTPVLAVSVDGDEYTPPATLDLLCRKLVNAAVVREQYTAAQAGAQLDHFTWVRAGAALARRIADFAARGA
jgi:predicted alpha/beta hydrolase